MREKRPRSRGEGSAEPGWSSRDRTDAGAAVWGPDFASRGWRVVKDIEVALSWHWLPPHLYSSVRGENDCALRSNEKIWAQTVRVMFEFICDRTSFFKSSGKVQKQFFLLRTFKSPPPNQTNLSYVWRLKARLHTFPKLRTN